MYENINKAVLVLSEEECKENNCVCVVITNSKEKDPQLQSINFPLDINEGRCAGHEFYHICRFLKFIDSEGFFKEKADEEKKSFYPFTAKASCQKLFENGEDMRNLCGFKITENGKVQEAIGEFDFWQEAISEITSKNPELKKAYILPIYKNVELDDNDKILLNQLFALKFLNIQGPTRMDASVILGSDFENFEIIDVPGDGNCGITSALVASGQISQNFETEQNGILSLTKEQKEKVIFCRQSAAKQALALPLSDGLSITTRCGFMGNWIENTDFVFVAQAINKPIVLVQPVVGDQRGYAMHLFTLDGQEQIYNSNAHETPQDIKTKHPNVVFIYFNGINHFQALVKR